MKEMLDKLPSSDFIRVHRSFIIPFSKIESVRNNTIITPHGEFSIGKTYIEEFSSRYS